MVPKEDGPVVVMKGHIVAPRTAAVQFVESFIVSAPRVANIHGVEPPLLLRRTGLDIRLFFLRQMDRLGHRRGKALVVRLIDILQHGAEKCDRDRQVRKGASNSRWSSSAVVLNSFCIPALPKHPLLEEIDVFLLPQKVSGILCLCPLQRPVPADVVISSRRGPVVWIVTFPATRQVKENIISSAVAGVEGFVVAGVEGSVFISDYIPGGWMKPGMVDDPVEELRIADRSRDL